MIKIKIILIAIGFTVSTSFLVAAEEPDYQYVYSDTMDHPETGDCLGTEVKLIKTKDSFSGVYDVYEGNCTPFSFELKKVEYEKDTGLLYFEAEGGGDYGKGLIQIFTGLLMEAKLTGYFEMKHKSNGVSASKYKGTLKRKDKGSSRYM